MIDLKYSLVIEATEEPDYFGFYSPDLEGFSGIGHSGTSAKHKSAHHNSERAMLAKNRLTSKADHLFRRGPVLRMRATGKPRNSGIPAISQALAAGLGEVINVDRRAL